MRPPRFTLTLISAFFLFACVGVILSASIGLALVKREAMTLPDVSLMREHISALTSKMVADDGTRIGQFAEQNRTAVPLSDIPAVVQRAFISAEDHNFWKHQGVDPFAIARAAVTNFRNKGTGRRPLGASTITQQVVKNLIAGDEQSFRRKVREVLLAIRLEREIGKQRVLELYLNEIYLGQGAYGVAAASEAYFGKPIADLDVAEAAFLAGMPKGPSNYDPVRHPDAAVGRRSYVIQRMLEDGVITNEQAREARMVPLPHPAPRNLGNAAEGYFAEEARRDVVARFGTAALYKGGLSIFTSMDPRLQALAEHTLREGLSDYDRRHGWRGPLTTLPPGTRMADPLSWLPALQEVDPPLGTEDWRLAAVLGFSRDGAIIGFLDGSKAVLGIDGMKWARRITPRGLGPTPRRPEDVFHPGDVILVTELGQGAQRHFEMRQIPEVEGALIAIEVSTGRVLAVAGGFSHERSSFDRATQSKRQPGSTFKPFIYLTAFQNGYDPTSPILDSPIAIEPAPGAPRWRPTEAGGGWGLISARRALENSRNLASVRLLYDLGLDSVSDLTKAFGLYESLPHFAAALGALEVTDIKLTAAYAMFANGGRRIVPTFIDRIEGPDGKLLSAREEFADTPANRVADPVATSQLVSVLEGVVRRGTAAGALSKNELPIAGKTGTTNDNLDAWFVGFTPDIAVGVHVGYDRPAPLGGTETGGHAASPIFGDFIKAATAIRPLTNNAFPVPVGMSKQRLDPVSGEPSKNGLEEIVRDQPAASNR